MERLLLCLIAIFGGFGFFLCIGSAVPGNSSETAIRLGHGIDEPHLLAGEILGVGKWHTLAIHAKNLAPDLDISVSPGVNLRLHKTDQVTLFFSTPGKKIITLRSGQECRVFLEETLVVRY